MKEKFNLLSYLIQAVISFISFTSFIYNVNFSYENILLNTLAIFIIITPFVIAILSRFINKCPRLEGAEGIFGAVLQILFLFLSFLILSIGKFINFGIR